MENKIKVSDYLNICLGIQDGTIDPEEGDKQITEFFEKLTIRSYMKHKDKIICLTKILFRMDAFSDEVALAAFLEMSRVSDGLFSYCINMENDLDIFGTTYGVCDLIHEFGLYDYIIKYCKEDYEIFSRMLSDMINISHIKQISNSAALFNEASFNEWLQGVKELKEELTPEILQGIIAINAQADGTQANIMDTFSKIAAEESDREMSKALFELSNMKKDSPEQAEEKKE